VERFKAAAEQQAARQLAPTWQPCSLSRGGAAAASRVTQAGPGKIIIIMIMMACCTGNVDGTRRASLPVTRSEARLRLSRLAWFPCQYAGGVTCKIP